MRLHDPHINNLERARRAEFASWLLQLGDGTLPTVGHNSCDIPIPCHFKGTLEQFINNIYSRVPKLAANMERGGGLQEYIQYLRQRCILAPLNCTVHQLNKQINDLLPGDAMTFLSNDGLDGSISGNRPDIPIEMLNAVNLNSWPPHVLELKPGSVAIVMRNLSPLLKNGTRVVVRKLQNFCLLATIITGPNKGTDVLIPRIKFIDTSHESGLPHKMFRKQFPLRLCWAMTINKAQGQTLPKVFLYLTDECFSHGQLYVAFSRAVSPCSVSVYNRREVNNIPVTANVVWKELLLPALDHRLNK